MNTHVIRSIGWTDERNKEFINLTSSFNPGEGVSPGRVIGKHHDLFHLQSDSGEYLCSPAGKLRKNRDSLWPAVGDWVMFHPMEETQSGIIRQVLSRTSSFTRTASGKRGGVQILAANIDYVFIVSGLDGDFNLRRIERFMTLSWNSGAMPVLILNKADISPDAEAMAAEAELYAPGSEVFIVSAKNSQGIDFISDKLKEGKTGVLVGSSGVGKSTLLNAVMGEKLQRTNTLRNTDHRGRHTTSSRQLFAPPGGGAIIDTPGLREVGIQAESRAMDTSFQEITQLAEDCRFSDCSHVHEPGCAILQALGDGLILPDRYEAYLKQRRELEFIQDRNSALQKKNEWQKDIARQLKLIKKMEGK